MVASAPRANLKVGLTLAADPLAVRAALCDLFRQIGPGHLDADHRDTLELILAEVLNNIVEHAYAERPGTIDLLVTARDALLWCEVTDRGLEMPGGEPPLGRAVAVDVPVDDLPEGGFGWFLIRTLTQDLTYQRDGNANRLAFSLALKPDVLVA